METNPAAYQPHPPIPQCKTPAVMDVNALEVFKSDRAIRIISALGNPSAKLDNSPDNRG